MSISSEQIARNVTLIQNTVRIITDALDDTGTALIEEFSMSMIAALSDANLNDLTPQIAHRLWQELRIVDFFRTDIEDKLVKLAQLLDGWRGQGNTDRIATEAEIAELAR